MRAIIVTPTIFVSIFLQCKLGLSDIEVDPSDKVIYGSLSTGKIQGRLINTAKQNEGYAFQGVPYADPPLGQLRYRLPVSKKPWNGTLECIQYGAACMSNSSQTTSPQSLISEDCLTLNVFLGKNCTKATPCPVLLYIHGGGWINDAPRMFPEEQLIDNFASKGIVAITVGYRLGNFGFFSTEDNSAAGNYGIYDIIQSLIWVQAEVKSLGGDPNTVTIMGHSSGATGVSLLASSPMAQGLFQRVVPISGSGIEKTDLNDSPATNREFAVRAGCATEEQWSGGDFEEILDCLRQKDGHDLILLQRQLEDEGLQFVGPRMDGPGGIFPESPDQLAKKRKPHEMMIGTVMNEFSPITATLKNVTEDTLKRMCENAIKNYGFKNVEEITIECLKTYNISGVSTIDKITSLMNDRASFVPVYQDAASMRDTGATVFIYSFDYVKRGMENVGTFHSMDLTYVFGIHPFTFDSRDLQISQIYPALFANFIKYGNPTPPASLKAESDETWKPLQTPVGYNYYSINLPKSTNQPLYHFRGIQFWTVTAPMMQQLFDELNVTSNSTKNEDSSVEIDSIPPITGPGSIDWETAFWITLVLGAVCLLALIFLVGIQCCAKKKFEKNDGEFDQPHPDETTGLLSSGSRGSGSNNGTSGSSSNNGQRSYI